MEIEYSQWLFIAAIHATIITVFITVSSAYLLFLRGRLDELESFIYQEANKINRLRFANSLGLKIEDKYECSDDKTRLELAKILGNIAMTGTPRLGLFEEKNLSIEKKKEVGTEAIKIMDTLSSYYPFPQRLIRGPKDGTHVANKPIRVKFTSIDDVIKWRNDVYVLTTILLDLWDNHRERFLDIIQPALEEHRKFFESRNIIPEVFVNTFFQNIREAHRIANSTEEKLMTWKAYQKRNEIKKPLITFLIFSIPVFLLGVFFPILCVFLPSFSQILSLKVALWLRIPLWFILAPFAFYFALFVLLRKILS